jgi:diguanylate cyclase (GGDEF)-like protein
VVANRAFATLVGLTADALAPGLSYQGMLERTEAAGLVSHRDLERLPQRPAKLAAGQARSDFTLELEDGRILMITHQPTSDGWLATYDNITEQRKAEARIVYLAHHDALTDLPNRVMFREKLEEALAYARRGQGLALLCLDLDQFKAVNDTLGHQVGDGLLQAVAERLSRETRETDLVARLGGDEFSIIQTPIDRPADAASFARRLNEILGAPFDVAGHQIVIGTSIGIAFAPQDSMDPVQLLKAADLALYRAKMDGRGVYRTFQAEMDAQMQVRRLMELDLRQALKAGQFELFYQPLVDPRAAAVVGFEALLRWRHPERGIVSPDKFIALAEEIGLIIPIGEWVLQSACAAVAAWPGGMRVAVNLSPAQFKGRNLVNAVAAALRETGLAPARLELEITETVMLQDTDATLATLSQLHALGVRIAMDDFGTGYSSLSYLRRFPFDRIKIDQSFVHDMCEKADCGAIVRAVTGLSNELGMATTAEGVETREQLDVLIRAGCTEIQGYLYSPAVPAAAVPAMLHEVAARLRPALARQGVLESDRSMVEGTV